MYNLVATSRDRYYSAELKERLGSFVAYEDLVLDLPRLRRWHPLNRSLYLGYKVHLSGLLLNQKGDRVAMANSVEARYPFLDEDVIAFASRLHPRWKLHGLRGDKYLLRQAAARLLPEAVAQRKKAMFRAPLAETFLAKPPSFVRDLISPDLLAGTGYFDAGAVQRDCAAVTRERGKLGTFASLGLGGVVATQLWHHLYSAADYAICRGSSSSRALCPRQRRPVPRGVRQALNCRADAHPINSLSGTERARSPDLVG